MLALKPTSAVNADPLKAATGKEWNPIRWMVEFILFIPAVLEGIIYHGLWHLLLGSYPKSPRYSAFFFRWLFDKASVRLGTVYKNRAFVGALEQLYDPAFQRDSETWFGKLAGDWFLGVRNAAAVRNRGVAVRDTVISEILRLHAASKRTHFTALSIACGSAHAMISAALYLKVEYGITLRLVLYDMDQVALDRAMGVAIKCGLDSSQLFCIRANARELNGKLSQHGLVPDMVEIVGLLDYFENAAAIRLLSRVREVLPEGRMVIVANVRPNSEMLFVTFALDWRMRYRWGIGLEKVLHKSGFEEAETFLEPARVYTIAIGR